MEEIIESYNEYLTKLPGGCLAIATLLREGDLHGALSSIKDFSEGTGWIMQVNEKLAAVSTIEKIDFKRIQEFLLEINSGLEIQDFVLVADLFEYEIAPFFECTN
ncbi:hypothetical protein [Kurthia sibirica]|nr:hypothetical protein [Kurthia sibirica]GEK33617.1 hypothetical protein KSI01_11500 [Kurthia sibirica]